MEEKTLHLRSLLEEERQNQLNSEREVLNKNQEHERLKTQVEEFKSQIQKVSQLNIKIWGGKTKLLSFDVRKKKQFIMPSRQLQRWKIPFNNLSLLIPLKNHKFVH